MAIFNSHLSTASMGCTRTDTRPANDKRIRTYSAQMLKNPIDIKEVIFADEKETGGTERPGVVIVPREKRSALTTNYGGDFMFERVWVEPERFDLSFITEDAEDVVRIWNAYRDQAIFTTDVSVTNQEGTLLDYPSLPHKIAAFGDTNYTLYVYGSGPPLQDTNYRLTIGGQVFDVPVTGIRIIAWGLDPNWDQGLELNYEFATTIYSNDKLIEQRRALSKESWLTVSGSYDIGGDRARRAHNLIAYGKDKVFGVPIFTEKLSTVIPLTGSTTITTEEDFSNYYNMQNNSEFVIIVDVKNELAEIKEVASHNGTNSIVLYQPISADFDVKTSFIYPCLFSIIKSVNATMHTDGFDTIMLDFREYKAGGI